MMNRVFTTKGKRTILRQVEKRGRDDLTKGKNTPQLQQSTDRRDY